MEESTLAQIMALQTKPLEELKAKYAELFKSEAPTSNNKVYLWRKLAYKLQEMDAGGLSEETQGRINDLIERYDPVNNKSLRPEGNSGEPAPKKGLARDRRLPIPGTLITKEYKGKIIEIKILETGFEYGGKVYKTLTSVAKEVTGAHWNGYLFFNI